MGEVVEVAAGEVGEPLIEVVHAADSNLVLRATALELLERRPPLGEPDSADSVVLQ